jgi:acyl-coenzyme A thioesterase PaaI-like protein
MLLKETLVLRGLGLLKIPMIFFLNPKVIEMSDRRVEIVIPLTYRSRNHLRSMYFGALCVGADCAGGMLAMKLIRESGKPVNLIFKDFDARFLKRAEADVHFICEDGEAIKRLVGDAVSKGERVSTSVHVVARTPKKTGNENIAEFRLTLSLKNKPKA